MTAARAEVRVRGRSSARVLAPAGMTATGSAPEDSVVPGRAVGYMGSAATGGVVPNRGTLPYRGTSAGGAPGMNGDLAIELPGGYVVAALSNLDPPAASARGQLRARAAAGAAVVRRARWWWTGAAPRGWETACNGMKRRIEPAPWFG